MPEANLAGPRRQIALKDMPEAGITKKKWVNGRIVAQSKHVDNAAATETSKPLSSSISRLWSNWLIPALWQHQGSM
jgi:hypothetical protein